MQGQFTGGQIREHKANDTPTLCLSDALAVAGAMGDFRRRFEVWVVRASLKPRSPFFTRLRAVLPDDLKRRLRVISDRVLPSTGLLFKCSRSGEDVRCQNPKISCTYSLK
jgi:hypothetical protein